MRGLRLVGARGTVHWCLLLREEVPGVRNPVLGHLLASLPVVPRMGPCMHTCAHSTAQLALRTAYGYGAGRTDTTSLTAVQGSPVGETSGEVSPVLPEALRTGGRKLGTRVEGLLRGLAVKRAASGLQYGTAPDHL